MQTVEQTFLIKNPGSKSITITDVRKSCSCTQVAIERDTLAPGTKALLTASISTGTLAGRLEVEMEVYYKAEGSGANERVLRTKVIGSVVALVELEPAILDFGKVDADAGERTMRAIVRRGQAKVDWDGVAFNKTNAFIKLSLDEVNADRFDLKVTLDPKQIPAGSFKTKVQGSFTLRGKLLQSEFAVPIEATVVSNFTASPATVYFGAVEPSEKARKEIVLSTRGTAALHFVSVTSNDAASFDVHQLDSDGESLRFSVQLRALAKTGNRSGWLRFKVKTDREREIVVPVIAYVKAASTSSAASETEKQ